LPKGEGLFPGPAKSIGFLKFSVQNGKQKQMITPQLLQNIAAAVDAYSLNESVVALLRGQFPGIHFTYCMEDDIPNHEPVLAGNGFNLYLVDGREHCLSLTRHFEDASGIVIAEILED
jgi:hypothetical protein